MKQSTLQAPSRVAEFTEPRINNQIQRQIAASIAFHADSPELIPGRLRDLNAEWDVERALETMSATVTLAGLALTVRRGPRWLALPFLVQGFFLQHAIQGWCPPLTLLRRAGFRTTEEIDQERHALWAILQAAGGEDARDGAIATEVEMKPREHASADRSGA